LDLTVAKEFSKVVGDEGGALVGPHDGGLECRGESHLSGHIGSEEAERGGGDNGCHAVRWEEATVAAAGIDGATVAGEGMRVTFDKGAGEVGVEDGTRRWPAVGWRPGGHEG
jgi:hypothetical protein